MMSNSKNMKNTKNTKNNKFEITIEATQSILDDEKLKQYFMFRECNIKKVKVLKDAKKAFITFNDIKSYETAIDIIPTAFKILPTNIKVADIYHQQKQILRKIDSLANLVQSVVSGLEQKVSDSFHVLEEELISTALFMSDRMGFDVSKIAEEMDYFEDSNRTSPSANASHQIDIEQSTRQFQQLPCANNLSELEVERIILAHTSSNNKLKFCVKVTGIRLCEKVNVIKSLLEQINQFYALGRNVRELLTCEPYLIGQDGLERVVVTSRDLEIKKRLFHSLGKLIRDVGDDTKSWTLTEYDEYLSEVKTNHIMPYANQCPSANNNREQTDIEKLLEDIEQSSRANNNCEQREVDTSIIE